MITDAVVNEQARPMRPRRFVALQAAGLYLLAAAALSFTYYYEVVLQPILFGEDNQVWKFLARFPVSPLWLLIAGLFVAAAALSLWRVRLGAGLALAAALYYAVVAMVIWGWVAMMLWGQFNYFVAYWVPQVVVFLTALFALFTLTSGGPPLGPVAWFARRAGFIPQFVASMTLVGAVAYVSMEALTPHPATSTYRVTWAAVTFSSCEGALELDLVDHPNYGLRVCSADLAAYLVAAGDGPTDLVLHQTYLLAYTIYAIERVGEWTGTATIYGSYKRCPSPCLYPNQDNSPFTYNYTFK